MDNESEMNNAINPELAELGLSKAEFDFSNEIPLIADAIAQWEKKNPDQHSLILIAGGTATGKGTFIERLNFDTENTSHINLDDYYLGEEVMNRELGFVNFSIPEAIDTKRLNIDIQKILSAEIGEIVLIPKFDLKMSKVSGNKELVVKHRIVIEGVYTIDQVEAATPFKIYIQSSPEIMLKRKLVRDVKERGLSPEIIKERFLSKVMPAMEQYVEPQKSKATIIVNNEEERLPEYS